MRIKKEENEHVNEHENEHENAYENDHKNEHECSICEISFSLATSLDKHVKVLHHEIEKNESTKKFIPEPKADIKLEKTHQKGHLETNSNSMHGFKSAENLQKNELTQKNDLPRDHGFDTSNQKSNNPESGISKINVRKQLYSKPFKCEKCGLRFKCENHLEIHDQIHSNSNFESYTCKFCTMTSRKIEIVAVHERIHAGENPIPCGFFGETFNHLIDKKRHELPHTGERPNICQFCDKEFRVQSDMKVHEKKCELNPERNIMNKSAKNYTIEHQQKLKNNDLIHKNESLHTGEKPHSCQFCGRKIRVRNMKKHEENCRSNPNRKLEIRYSCRFCGEKFRVQKIKKLHVRYCAKESTNQPKISPPRLKIKKKTSNYEIQPQHKCHICSESFVTPEILKQHLKAHLAPSKLLHKLIYLFKKKDHHRYFAKPVTAKEAFYNDYTGGPQIVRFHLVRSPV